jgi:hypothetical protein
MSSREDAIHVSRPDPMSVNEGARCDTCGAFGAFDLGDRKLCEDCYRACGSCCPEFGGHDLWAEDD